MFYGTEQLHPSSLVERPHGLCTPCAAEHIPSPVPVSSPASLTADTLHEVTSPRGVSAGDGLHSGLIPLFLRA